LSVSEHSIKEEQSVQENVSINVSPKENENLNFKNNTCTIKQETSREITDDLFSQVSPTVMEEMCSVGSDQNEKSPQISESERISSLTSDNASSDSNNNADDTIKLPITNSINEETLVHSPDITIMKSETTTSSSNCSSVEEFLKFKFSFSFGETLIETFSCTDCSSLMECSETDNDSGSKFVQLYISPGLESMSTSLIRSLINLTRFVDIGVFFFEVDKIDL
jgi:hypothetical protein